MDYTPRLLVVTTVPATVKGFLLPYLDHLRTQGWTVDVATGPGDDLEAVRPHVAALHVMPWSRSPVRLSNMVAAGRLRHLVRHGRYDVMHTHTPNASLLARLALAGLGPDRPRVVYTAHGFHFHGGGQPLTNSIYATAERIAGRWTDRLVVINDEDARAAVSRRVVPATSVVPMPGIGIDLSEYRPSDDRRNAASAVRRDLGLGGEDVLFSVVAELQYGKNHEVVLRAMARNGHPRYHLACAGSGPERARIEAVAANLHISGRVHLLGRISDVRPLILASAATILVSRREGLSRAVLESLALGVPVIGSTARGVRDLVGPDAGIIVDPDDVDGLSRALDDIRDLPTGGALRPVIADQLARYGIENLLSAHDALYEELLAR
jgi:glycosyltransferase involved in cell wall biosynthesis